ncbi:MAG: restriction endonuclease subunit S [Polaromonas sp.]|uniref:restriction endonuclease subunit S n=1 Tax=Polaromonas sp. TaxID=1869339 RepID=UPI002736BF26|nr:restriction endonuclease subunit S [Polaromonas sp.]MDP2817446.1 restriction endonuclease subunit S [Polaromonas sp.]
MLLSNLNLLATAPGGVARLRELILTLAVQGKLVPQDPKDESASELLKKIRAEKDRLIAHGKIKRDKPLAEIAAEEKPFGLPRGWEWVRLPEVTHNLGQGAPAERFTYIDVAAIDNEGGFVKDAAEIVEAVDAPSRARKNVAVGTVLYSTVRPYLKNIAVVEKDYEPKAIASTAFAIMHPHGGLHSKYLLHYLRSAIFTDFVSSKAVGVAYPAINDANFFEGVVALPPTKEQTRIVTRVEELMRLCDALEAKGQLEATQHDQLVSTLLGALTESETPGQLTDNWHRIATHFDLLLDRPEAVDALEQTILQLAVRGLLVPQDPQDQPASELLKKIRLEKDKLIAEGKIKRDKPLPPIAEDEQPFALPRGWSWARFPELGDFGRGKSKHRPRNDPSLFNPPKYPLIQTGEVSRAKGIVQEVHSYYSDIGLAQSLMWPKGTLCITIAANIAESAVLGFDSCFPDSVVGFVPATAMGNVEYFLLFVETARADLLAFAPATAQKNINLEILSSLLIPVPPLNELTRIVTRVASLRRLCADLRQRLTASQSTQANLAEALVESIAS